MKRKKTLLSLMVLLVILAVAYLSITKLTKTSDEETQSDDTSTVVAEFSSEDLTQISWTYGGETIVLNKEDDTWSVSDKSDFPLDTSIVDSMINASVSITASRVLEDSSNLEEYGLDDPALTITLKSSDQEVICLIGDQNSLTDEYYLKLSDSDSIYLVDSTLWDNYACGLYDLAETEEIPTMSTITDILITSGETTREVEYIVQNEGLSYTDKYLWYYSESGSQTLEPADSSKVSELQSLITGLTWVSCVSYNADETALEGYGLLNPQLKIDVTYKETETVETDETNEDGSNATEEIEYERVFTLLIGNEADGYTYAKLENSNMVYQISSQVAESFSNVSALSLAPEDVCLMDWDTVDSMEITLNGQTKTLTFERSETEDEDGNTETTCTYTLDGTEIDTEAVEEFLDQITSLAVESTVEGQELGESEMDITFHRNTETFSTMTLSLGAYDSSFYLVDFNGASRLLINKNDFTRLKTLFEGLDS